MGEPLRGGVIGAGVFGGHHARKYAGAKGAVLSAVLDTHHPDRAAALAVPLGGRAFHKIDEFLEACDSLDDGTLVLSGARGLSRVEPARLAVESR